MCREVHRDCAPREEMGDVYEVPEEDVEVIWDGVIESEEEDDESEEDDDER